MASIKHLEKLLQIEKLFYVEDSLEAAVAGERVTKIIQRTEQMIKQRAFLREERRRIRVAAERVDDRKCNLDIIRKKDWMPATLLAKEEKNLRINIGGLMFEIPPSILQRDPKSLLAQLCTDDPPVLADPEGFFYFDRDWWLFRYILIFLRDGTLPTDRNLLTQIYREAGFWHLNELHQAIEEEKLHLKHENKDNKKSDGSSSSSSDNKEKEADKKWWKKVPEWLKFVQINDKDKNKENTSGGYGNSSSSGNDNKNDDKKDKKPDWWKDTAYNGKVFLPLSSSPEKLVTKQGMNDAKKVPTTVWGTGREYHDDDDDYDERGPRHSSSYDRDSRHQYNTSSRKQDSYDNRRNESFGYSNGYTYGTNKGTNKLNYFLDGGVTSSGIAAAGITSSGITAGGGNSSSSSDFKIDYSSKGNDYGLDAAKDAAQAAILKFQNEVAKSLVGGP